MLERVKKGDKLLDLGCAFGQELRQLVSYYTCFQRLLGSILIWANRET